MILEINGRDKIKFKAEYILHFAGQSSGEKSYYDPVQDLNNNTLTTLNLINYGDITKPVTCHMLTVILTYVTCLI